MWYWHKNRYIDQWNRIESPEINPCIYGQLIYNKGAKNIQWIKDSLFNKWCWESWTTICKKNETRSLSHIIHQSQFKMDWRLKCKTWNHKTPTRKCREKVSWHWFVQWFLHMTPKAQATNTKTDKWNCIELKSFCTAKETIGWKNNLWNGRKYSQTI